MGTAVLDRVQERIDFYKQTALADPEVHEMVRRGVKTMRQ